MKFSVYLESTVVSYLAADGSANPATAMRQAVTRRWWEQERHKYDLFVSEAVENECRRGDPIAVATVYRIDYLATWNIRHIANAQIRRITLRGGRLGPMTRFCKRYTPCVRNMLPSMATTSSGCSKI